MADNLTLYDLGRRGPENTCWSYNVWKTRIALNYKDIPYTTHWVNHLTLGPTVKALGVKENPPASAGPPVSPYTVPIIELSDGTAVMDSAAIASKLEELHPTPSLHLDAQLEAEVDSVVRAAALPLVPVYMPCIAKHVIDPSTVSKFKAGPEKRFGVSLDELERTKGGEVAWEAVKPAASNLVELLKRHKKDDGPFLRGSQVSYADFLIVAFFEAARGIDPAIFERLVKMNPAFEELYAASEKWLQKNT
ncbi:hypothetical protein ANO11243_096240 [Dothideomycetidae sp. 11243]|nr:hypothetical protein ANO11243_096240 [fungal sp. No.11243]